MFHAPINFLLVATRLLFENRSQGRARVFRINVDSSGEDCLLADKCSSQVKTALHSHVVAGFDALSEQLSEDELFGEILGANDNPIGMAFAAHNRN